MAGRDLSTVALSELRIAETDPQDRVAKHFKLYELSVSELADRQRIDNRIADDAPNSVFRSQALERALKAKPSSWISTSQHAEGRACDVEIVAKPTLELAAWASTTLPEFDQIICECYDPRKGPNSGWVHISLLPPGAGRNRRQVLSYVVDPGSGRLVYVNGLQASEA